MTNFSQVHGFTQKWEGGLSDHPSDPGGITNYGVSLRWLRSLQLAEADIDEDGDIDADDIRALTPTQAAELFKARFWNAYHMEEFAPPLAAVLYDTAVNCGPRQAIRLVQRASNDLVPLNINKSALAPPLVADGKLGPLTRAALHAHSPLLLAKRFIDRRQEFYQRLVLEQPDQYGDFLRGWFRRCDALRVHACELVTTGGMV